MNTTFWYQDMFLIVIFAIVHVNCLDFSLCLYYELTNSKKALLKPRNAGNEGYFQLCII